MFTKQKTNQQSTTVNKHNNKPQMHQHIPNMLDRGFAAGLLDSYAAAYFLGLSALFLFLTWVRLVSRRWVP